MKLVCSDTYTGRAALEYWNCSYYNTWIESSWGDRRGVYIILVYYIDVRGGKTVDRELLKTLDLGYIVRVYTSIIFTHIDRHYNDSNSPIIVKMCYY